MINVVYEDDNMKLHNERGQARPVCDTELVKLRVNDNVTSHSRTQDRDRETALKVCLYMWEKFDCIPPL